METTEQKEQQWNLGLDELQIRYYDRCFGEIRYWFERITEPKFLLLITPGCDGTVRDEMINLHNTIFK